MNKEQKELIAKCEPYVDGTPFKSFYVIPSGKLYTGFWGKNGFNKIYIICRNGDKLYLVGEYQCDVLDILPLHSLHIDVPHKFNALLFVGNYEFVIHNSNVSTITIEEVSRE